MNPKDRYLVELSEHEWDIAVFDDDGTKFTIVETPHGVVPPNHLPEEDKKALRDVKGYIVRTYPNGTSHVDVFEDLDTFLTSCLYIVMSKAIDLESYHD